MTTQPATSIKPTAPLQSRPELIWLGFTPDTDFDTAARIFEKRHGHPPATLTRFGGWLRVGPIGEEEAP